MTQIQTGRYQRFARLLLGVRGPGAFSDVEEALVPTLTVDGDRPEHGVLKQVTPWAFRISTPGAAGLICFHELRNPAGSSVLAVVDYISPRNNQDFFYTLRDNAAGFLGAAVGPRNAGIISRDGRTGVRGAVLEVRDDNASFAALPFAPQWVNPVDRGSPAPPWWVIPPGYSLIIAYTTQNASIDLAYSWYERPAEPDELRAL